MGNLSFQVTIGADGVAYRTETDRLPEEDQTDEGFHPTWMPSCSDKPDVKDRTAIRTDTSSGRFRKVTDQIRAEDPEVEVVRGFPSLV